MTKLKSFLTALVLVIATLCLIEFGAVRVIDRISDPILRNYGNDSKFKAPEVLKGLLDKNTFVIMGSSELNSDSDKPANPFRYFNHENLNLLKVGLGGYQSLIHTGLLGTIGPEIQTHKVMLILSPQWFTKEGISAAAVMDKLSYTAIDEFLRNPALSKRLKTAFIDRLSKLTSEYPAYSDKVRDIAAAALKDTNPLLNIPSGIKLRADAFKHKVKLGMDLFKIKETAGYKETPLSFSADELLAAAKQTAKSASTNNDFYVEDEYYKEHIEDKLEQFKNMETDLSYTESPEYEDLKLFLACAKEQGIEVHLVSIPLSGHWADHTGFPADNRAEYYEKIRNLAESEGVRLLDLSTYEYEPYFLKDIMHLGEVGWVQIDREILRMKGVSDE